MLKIWHNQGVPSRASFCDFLLGCDRLGSGIKLWTTAICLAAGLSGCQFDPTIAGAKTACRTNSDCVPSLVCSRCEVCVDPSLFDASCVEDVSDAANGASGSTDTGLCPTPNACGGCQPLERQPGASCGDCGGELVCDSAEILRCQGGDLNLCGGCGDLPAAPGDSCGPCSNQRWQCEDDGQLSCQSPTLNACGGCLDLVERPGARCGLCELGVWTCDDDANSVICSEPDGRDVCGGCGADGQPGEACGCGEGEQFVCEEGELRCLDGVGGRNGPVSLGDLLGSAPLASVSGVLSNEHDQDWYVADINDGLSTISPMINLSSSEEVTLELCAFYVWLNDASLGAECEVGAPIEDEGLTGCCATGGAADIVEVRLSSIDRFLRVDSGRLYIKVSSTSPVVCAPFVLSYRL